MACQTIGDLKAQIAEIEIQEVLQRRTRAQKAPQQEVRQEIRNALEPHVRMNGILPKLRDIYPQGHPKVSWRRLREIYWHEANMMTELLQEKSPFGRLSRF